MTTAQQVLNYAANEIGYRETPNNYSKYGAWYGINPAMWCAMFVSYCFYRTGLPLPANTPKGFAYCGHGIQWFRDKGWWHTTPKVGDVVFYNWYNGGDPYDHVGIVEKVNADGSIVAIEGNQDNQVKRVTRSSNIIGYGRPPYNGVTPPPPPPLPHSPWPGRYIVLTSPYMQGSDVLLWQRQMIYRGWDLGPFGPTGKGDDGVFGEDSHEALIEFQKQKGLEVDGKIGPDSWDAVWERPITPE